MRKHKGLCFMHEARTECARGNVSLTTEGLKTENKHDSMQKAFCAHEENAQCDAHRACAKRAHKKCVLRAACAHEDSVKKLARRSNYNVRMLTKTER